MVETKNHSSSFSTQRVNKTTFAVTEQDSWEERPIIYVKQFPNDPFILISDTGCDSPDDSHASARYTHLLDYLQNCPVAVNANQPLDTNPGSRRYFVVSTHCHFDHINGIEQLASIPSSEIIASHSGRDFVTKDLATHSLCAELGVPVPRCTVTKWAKNRSGLFYFPATGEVVVSNRSAVLDADPKAVDLEITIFNTPGHTPDELAWFDHEESHLYVGDSFYTTPRGKSSARSNEGDGAYEGPIIFPKEGSFVSFLESMGDLLAFVRDTNLDMKSQDKRVRVGCGHRNVDEDAEVMIEKVIDFVEKIVAGASAVEKTEIRGETNGLWRSECGQFAVRAPLRLADEARRSRRS